MNVSSTRNLHWRLIATAAVLVVVGVIAIFAATTHADSSTADATADRTAPFYPPATTPEQAAAARAGFQAQFSALRDPGAAIPEASVIDDPGVDRSAAHVIVPASAPALAAVGAGVPKARLWAAPRDDGTECLLAQPADAQGPAELCAALKDAGDGYLFMTQSRSASDVEVYGLLPDGVEAVTVAFADGTSTTLPVADNAYAAHFDKPTASIAFTDAAGAAHKLVAGSGG